jgi:hypothetical protein
MNPLISVHIAKAGGSSLLRIFEGRFGTGLVKDYAENPADPLSPRNLDPDRYFAQQTRISEGVACVHGHFHPGKYAIPANAILSTILRHPVDNIISIHFFWKTLARGHDALHDYFLAQNLSLLETAKLPLLRHLFSKTYFQGFDMGRFNLVGRHDSRDAVLAKIGALTGGTFETGIHENVTQPTPERQEAASSPRMRRALEDILVDDIRFYERFAR